MNPWNEGFHYPNRPSTTEIIDVNGADGQNPKANPEYNNKFIYFLFLSQYSIYNS